MATSKKRTPTQRTAPSLSVAYQTMPAIAARMAPSQYGCHRFITDLSRSETYDALMRWSEKSYPQSQRCPVGGFVRPHRGQSIAVYRTRGDKALHPTRFRDTARGSGVNTQVESPDRARAGVKTQGGKPSGDAEKRDSLAGYSRPHPQMWNFHFKNSQTDPTSEPRTATRTMMYSSRSKKS